jgi:hypothetical protein
VQKSLLVVVLALAFAASAQAARTIATATTTDYRVVLTASKRGGGQAPAATVRIAISQRSGNGWRPIGARRVPGTYFWNTVTGARAVCKLDVRTTGEARVVVQLLVTPSVGCGRAHSYPLVSAP